MPRLVLLAVLLSLAATGLALAATPKGGATYSGKLGEGVVEGKIKLKVFASKAKMNVTFGCTGTLFTLKGVPIKQDGRFKGSGELSRGGERSGQFAAIKGRFTSGRIAKGEVKTQICFYDAGARFSAER